MRSDLMTNWGRTLDSDSRDCLMSLKIVWGIWGKEGVIWMTSAMTSAMATEMTSTMTSERKSWRSSLQSDVVVLKMGITNARYKTG